MLKKIAFIGGSGLYDLHFLKKFKYHKIKSYFGSPSGSILSAQINNNEIIEIILKDKISNFITRGLGRSYGDSSLADNVISLKNTVIKTLGFTYLNPHVYSDTVFFLGNFSKNFLISQKYYFGIGAAVASFLFFFCLGYLSKFLSKYLQKQIVWKFINSFIVVFMSILAFYVLLDIIY